MRFKLIGLAATVLMLLAAGPVFAQSESETVTLAVEGMV